MKRIGPLFVALSLSLGASAQQSEDRVDPSGPYRSKMRILESGQPTVPANLPTLPARSAGYATALNERAEGYRRARDGDTGAAIAALQKALDSDALAPLAQTTLRRDVIALMDSIDDAPGIAQAHARWRGQGAVFDALTSMRAARAYATLERFDDAIAAIDQALDNTADAPTAWQQLKVFVLARLARYEPAAALAASLLDAQSTDPQAWRNLVELQRASNDVRRATATLELAYERGVLRTAIDTQNLAKLYLASGLPDHALILLNDRLADGALTPDTAVYRLVIRSALRAGDPAAAVAPSLALATLTDQSDDWFALAQLNATLDQSNAALEHVQRALRKDLGPARGRALILLGETHIALGNERQARQAFRQASDLGGVYKQAQAYLANLTMAEPQTERAGLPVTREEPAAAAPIIPGEIKRKRLPRLRFFFLRETLTATQLPNRLRKMIRQVRTAVRRERLSASGPLQWQIDGAELAAGGRFEVRLGVPVRTRVPPRGRLRNQDLLPMECAYRVFEGPPTGLADAWRAFLADLGTAGLSPGRDSRTLILNSNAGNGRVRFELQIELIDD